MGGFRKQNTNAKRVTIKQGELEGYRLKTYKGENAVKFLGIPYAVQPVGEKRFAHPEPAEPWEGVFKANKHAKCPQYMFSAMQGVLGQEDALQLHVYTTEKILEEKESSKVPVMVMIHGGAFYVYSGGPDTYGPEWILDHGVVMVAINYRLGPLGFLSTGDDVIPANLGLWDQRMALMWVRDNIAAFGGDPGNVTIYGESAGAMSCIYHMVSPQSAGLFHGIIAQSGTPGSCFCHTDKHPSYVTRKFVKSLGGDPTGSSEDIKKFLMGLSVKDIIINCLASKVHDPEEQVYDMEWYYFLPIVDDFCSKPFLPEEPMELIKKGKFHSVPIICGYCKEEGLVFEVGLKKNSKTYQKMDRDWDRYAARLFFNRDSDEVDENDRKATQMLLEKHFGGKKPTHETRRKLMMASGDAMFMAQSNDFCQAVAAAPGEPKRPVYQYRYSYPSPISMVDFFQPVWRILGRMVCNKLGIDALRGSLGAAHCDDVFLMYQLNGLPFKQRWTDEDFLVSNRLLTMFTNFAKRRDPTPPGKEAWEEEGLGYKWDQVVAGKDAYLEIMAETPKMWQDPEEVERLKLWREVFELVPRCLRLKRSKSWEDPIGPFRQKEKEKEEKEEEGGAKEKKDEAKDDKSEAKDEKAEAKTEKAEEK